jgi:hypothetical protein
MMSQRNNPLSLRAGTDSRRCEPEVGFQEVCGCQHRSFCSIHRTSRTEAATSPARRHRTLAPRDCREKPRVPFAARFAIAWIYEVTGPPPTAARNRTPYLPRTSLSRYLSRLSFASSGACYPRRSCLPHPKSQPLFTLWPRFWPGAPATFSAATPPAVPTRSS